jgi:E3 ubiquitin-protein ligase BAH
VDANDGSPQDCWLSPDTREYLVGLSKARSRASTNSSPGPPSLGDQLNNVDAISPNGEAGGYAPRTVAPPPGLRTVEVPLASDSTFFQILDMELSSLSALQEREKSSLTQEIIQVGDEIKAVSDTASAGSKSDLDSWREIFRLYIESQVFFSTGERDAGMRGSSSAQRQLQLFTEAVLRQKRGLRLKKSNKATLDRFIHVNLKLLKNLKFHEINRLALTKIMKSIALEHRFSLLATNHSQSSTNAQRCMLKRPYQPSYPPNPRWHKQWRRQSASISQRAFSTSFPSSPTTSAPYALAFRTNPYGFDAATSSVSAASW